MPPHNDNNQSLSYQSIDLFGFVVVKYGTAADVTKWDASGASSPVRSKYGIEGGGALPP
jgi:hypothetical protein